MNALKALVPLGLVLLLSACATVNGPTDPRDPWEGFNRSMYAFNDTLDRTVMRPVAKAYKAVVPDPIETGISNFFSNLDDVVVLVNDILQLKIKQAVSDLGRIAFNSTAGLLGFIDVATPMGFPKHDEDFGQTLGYWGVPSGPYLVLPILGPSTLRDGSAKPVDWQADPLINIRDDSTYWGAVVLRGIDQRAQLLRASRILETAALDPYVFLRDAYLQRRRNQVYDGHPPMPELDIFDQDSEGPPLPPE